MELQTPSSTTPEEVHGNKKLLTGLLVLILIVAGLGYYFFSLPPQITGLEVAQKTSTFLDKLLLADGQMLGKFECNQLDNNKCVAVALSEVQPHVGQAIYGYFILSEVSNDPTQKEKADRAINYVLDTCDTNPLMCEWNFFPLARYYEQTHEDKYLTRGMLRPAERFLAMPSEDAITANVGHKLASLYQFTHDTRYRNRLVEIADEQLQKTLGPKEFLTGIHVAWSLYIPAFQATGDRKYLAAAEEFFDNLYIADNFSKYNKVDGLVKAADVLLTMSEISNKGGAYRAQAHSVLQEVLVRLWDTPERPIFNGDYGFLNSNIADNKADKLTLHNGWLIKLFSLAANDKFELPVQ